MKEGVCEPATGLEQIAEADQLFPAAEIESKRQGETPPEIDLSERYRLPNVLFGKLKRVNQNDENVKKSGKE